uniref:Uncharacterized protein n=1 Tax=Anguilla anguilla TaxID=7936 RepID=A0A0E9WUB7_ANGAN
MYHHLRNTLSMSSISNTHLTRFGTGKLTVTANPNSNQTERCPSPVSM